MKDLRDKVAVVTGGASGIGRGMADAFLAIGMKVVLADVEAPALEATAAELASRGEVRAVRTDVSRAGDLDALAEQAWKEFGAIHVLCNNAGVGPFRLLRETPLEDWHWVLAVNLLGVVHGIRSFLPRMERQGEGHIVNTASMAGVLSFPMAGAYSASKQAVVALSETLAQELRAEGSPLRVSVLCPAYVRTNIIHSERNRPDRKTPYEREKFPADHPSSLVERIGMDPVEVGRMVIEAIREERFYVFTHPDWKPLIRERFEAILADACPPAPSPPP